MLSKRALSMKPSPTLALVAQAAQLKAKGHDVISLSVGEPDWPTFKAPSDAGIKAIQESFSKYTPASGLPELRTAIAKQTEKELGISYTANQVTVGTGAKFILFAACQMLCNEGDEVIIPAPYWVSYPVMVELAGGVSRIVECGRESKFKITPDQLKRAITPKTKAFIFSSPSNPTGISYSKSELKALAEVFKANPHVFIISDDIYNRLMFGSEKIAPEILQVAPELADRTLVVNGVSKSYSMTGWRIGWALGPEKIIKAMADYQSQATSSASSISQRAALAAIENCDGDIARSVEMLKSRLAAAMSELKGVPLINPVNPDGAFYIWMDISKTFGKVHKGQTIKDSRDFASIFLSEYFVATVPGVEFGAEGYLRISFAIETPRMQEAIRRLKQMIEILS